MRYFSNESTKNKHDIHEDDEPSRNRRDEFKDDEEIMDHFYDKFELLF